jgi:hypothetical protein
MARLLAVAFVVLLGLYFMTHPTAAREGYCTSDRDPPYRCPNLLIQNGAELELRNTRLADVPGVNPIRFANLEQYVEFTHWQRSQGIRCPVLFLQHAYDAQGRPVYKVRPSPTDLKGGAPDLFPRSTPPTHSPIPTSKLLDAARDDPPYNQKSYPGYDPQDQYIGLYTPLDKMFHGQDDAPSPSAMDTTWAGQRYSQALVDAGYYKGDEIGFYTSK